MVKNLPANTGDLDLIPGSGRPPGEGNGNPLQYSCLENSIDRGYNPWDCKELDTTEQLTHPHPFIIHKLQPFHVHKTCVFFKVVIQWL